MLGWIIKYYHNKYTFSQVPLNFTSASELFLFVQTTTSVGSIIPVYFYLGFMRYKMFKQMVSILMSLFNYLCKNICWMGPVSQLFASYFFIKKLLFSSYFISENKEGSGANTITEM